jgi:hypothetical protein
MSCLFAASIQPSFSLSSIDHRFALFTHHVAEHREPAPTSVDYKTKKPTLSNILLVVVVAQLLLSIKKKKKKKK